MELYTYNGQMFVPLKNLLEEHCKEVKTYGYPGNKEYTIRIFNHYELEGKDDGLLVWSGEITEWEKIPKCYYNAMKICKVHEYGDEYCDYHIFANVLDQKTISLNELSEVVDLLRNHSKPELTPDEILDFFMNPRQMHKALLIQNGILEVIQKSKK